MRTRDDTHQMIEYAQRMRRRAEEAEAKLAEAEAVLKSISIRPPLPGPHSDDCQCSIHQAKRYCEIRKS